MAQHTDSARVVTGSRSARPQINIARIVSLVLSAGLALLIILWPGAILGSQRLLTQAVMPVMLLGIAGGALHGLDLAPRQGVAATMCGPWVTWPLMLSSLAFLFLQNDL